MRPMDKQEWSRQRFPALLDSAPHRIQGGPPKIKRTSRDTLKGNIFLPKTLIAAQNYNQYFQNYNLLRIILKFLRFAKSNSPQVHIFKACHCHFHVIYIYHLIPLVI
jgi:hypothetical protein